MQIDIEKAIKELVCKGVKLPPQPEVMLKLQAKLGADNFSIKEIASIISHDPGITAMLFKTVRSPVFGCKKQLDSVEQVLMVIGIKQTCNLVQAIALATSISSATRKSFDSFWTRSQEIAQLAALIAADCVSVCNIFPDQAYMAGIFHECGVPILMQRFPDYCAKLHLDNANCWPDLIEEDALYNVDHCSIGYLVAHHWKLPDFICNAILYHHEIPHEELGAVRTLVAILQMAIHIYHQVTRTEDLLWPKIGAEVLYELGVPLDRDQAYYEEIIEKFLD
jgi:HD-like signal output (HDOD) protein